MSGREKDKSGEFFSNLSHNVRQPLNGVIEVLASMSQTDLPPPQTHSLKAVQKAAHGLVMTVNDILDLTRIEEGNFRLFTDRFDLRMLIETVAEVLAREAVERGSELQCLIHPEVPAFVRGDAGRVRQALENLVRVCAAYAVRGPILMDATLDSETPESLSVRFAVTDAESILPRSISDSMTAPGAPLWTKAAEDDPATCLRLSLARRIGEMMGGVFGIDRDDDGGASYWFSARFEPAESPAETKPPAADVSGLRVLLVVDECGSSEETEKFLASRGCRTAVAEISASPLTTLKEARSATPFDVVIIETKVRGQEGEDLGRAIRRDADFDQTALVMLSSAGRRGDAARLREIGFTAFLTKPIEQTELAQALSKVASLRYSPAPDQIITRHSLFEDRKSRIRILLATGDSNDRFIIQRLLEKHGYRVVYAGDAAEALEMLKDSPFDLVIADPKYGGLDLTKSLREKSPEGGRIPIVGLYDNADLSEKTACINAGMDGALPRPYAPEEFLIAVLEHLMGKTAPQRDN